MKKKIENSLRKLRAEYKRIGKREKWMILIVLFFAFLFGNIVAIGYGKIIAAKRKLPTITVPMGIPTQQSIK